MNLSSARQGSSSVCLALQFSAPFVLLINRCCAGQLYVSSENVNRKCKHTERGTVCENVAEEKGIFAAINGWYFKPDTVQNRICCWMMRSVVCACVVFSYSFRLEDEKSSIISLFKHACIKMCGVDFICNAFFPFFWRKLMWDCHLPACIALYVFQFSANHRQDNTTLYMLYAKIL